MEITTTARSSGRVARLLVNLACLVCMVVALGFIAPAAFGYQRYVITGSSMTGTVDLGSVVFAEVVPVDELEVGDVITYLPPPESGVDDLVTHRIVSIDGDVSGPRATRTATPTRGPSACSRARSRASSSTCRTSATRSSRCTTGRCGWC